MGKDKTHYRKVFKSDHLGVADLEDMIEASKRLVFVIEQVKQEFNVSVAGRKGNFNIAYFREDIKPLVLNATNSKTMKKLTGSAFVEDWSNTTVELYIDANAKMKGEIVGGVRISPNKAKIEKPELKEGAPAFTNAVAAYKRDGNLDAVRKRMIVAKDVEEMIIEAAKNVS
jgi:hypothetical protein